MAAAIRIASPGEVAKELLPVRQHAVLDDKAVVECQPADAVATDLSSDRGRAEQCATMCAFDEAVNFRQDVSIGQLRYNRFAGAWLNEAKVDYSRFRRNPAPNTPGLPARVYTYRDATTNNNTDNFLGSNLHGAEDVFAQKRLVRRIRGIGLALVDERRDLVVE